MPLKQAGNDCFAQKALHLLRTEQKKRVDRTNQMEKWAEEPKGHFVRISPLGAGDRK